jgi:hypothetical protein
LSLQGELAEEWDKYVDMLKHSAIKLLEEEDQLKWYRNKGTGVYTFKLGYKVKVMEEMV